MSVLRPVHEEYMDTHAPPYYIEAMDRKTIETYNTHALEYDDETASFWDEFPDEIIANFTADLPAKGSILDVGSGPGRDGVMLSNLEFRVTCLDASSVMVDLCRKKGLDAVVGDMHTLPFQDAAFDGVWAYTSFLHTSKARLPQVLREIHRVLKEGGMLGFGMIEGDTEGYRTSMADDAPRWFAYYTTKELEDALRDAGLPIIFSHTFKPGSRNYFNIIARKSAPK